MSNIFHIPTHGGATFRRSLILAAAAAAMLAGQAIAEPLAQPAAPTPTPEKCAVSVLDDDAGGPLEATAEDTEDRTLADVLAPCDGVLEPAPIGDQEIALPPPAGGVTPVIPPEAIPEQPAEND